MSHRTKNRPRHADPISLPLIVGLLTIFVGVALAMILGPHFTFLHSAFFLDSALLAFLMLLPLITMLMLASAKGKVWRSRFSLARIPQALGWALGIAALCVSIIVSPTGYIALANEIVGYDVTVRAKVLSVWDVIQQRPSRKNRCTRFATVLVGDRTTQLCLADHYQANENIQGQDVLLQVRQSPFGYSIGQMALAR